VLADDGNGVEIVLLSLLGGNLLHDGLEVRLVLLWSGELVDAFIHDVSGS
jgi:hypothetical protein